MKNKWLKVKGGELKVNGQWLMVIGLSFIIYHLSFSHAVAQGMKPEGRSISELVPQGWTHQEATGDLNKDGVADLVISATPDSVEHIVVRDDGYTFNYNRPILAIYWGTADGRYTLFKMYKETIPAEGEGVSIDDTYTITERGTLCIGLTYFYSMGSGSNQNSSYIFRYQDGDFFLIGEEQQEQSRMTGELQKISINYLTNKKQIKTENVFDDSVPQREKWEKFPKEPLRPLGSWEL
ncbi:MAG: hypothetical protein K6D61_01550 [Prevotella sp.]|nr:hypothetical protein [Prevotella sp.]